MCKDDYKRWHLIVTGPRVGEVWLESELSVVRYPNSTFTPRFISWLIVMHWGKLYSHCNLERYAEDERAEPWYYSILKNLKGCVTVFTSELSQDPVQLFMILNGGFHGEIWIANQNYLIVRRYFRFKDREKVNLFNL